MFYSHEFGARPSLVNIENKGEMKFQTLFSFAFLPRLNTISIVIQAFTGMGDFFACLYTITIMQNACRHIALSFLFAV